MELKNITPFQNFRRIFEASGELSNNTGFKESLVGRAMFGILRYFKKGIDLGKLEYYKRKLENEYFAAILRFCAFKGIDLKTGIDPSPPDNANAGGNSGGPAPVDQYEIEFCEILGYDCVTNGVGNVDNLTDKKTQYVNYVASLNNIIPNLTSQDDIDDCNSLIQDSNKIIKCCDDKIAINAIFLVLSGLTGSVDAQIPTHLEQIKVFLGSDSAKLCSTYKGTVNEKNLIRSFSTSTDANIKTKADEVALLLDNYKYDNFDFVFEAITSGINKSVNITQMLGDQLRGADVPSQKVNIYDYLKKIGIDSVDDINFVELVKLFRSKPEYQKLVSSEVYLNYAGIRKIQYAVADGIIFHVKKTPDNVGINPGIGGGAGMAGGYDEDTSMRKVWEQKVEFIKSEFNGFFTFDIVDPFVLLNLSDALRKRDVYGKDTSVLQNQGNTGNLGNTLAMETNATKMGLKAMGDQDIHTERTPFVFSFIKGNKTHYIVLSLSRFHTGDLAIYRYIGCINFNKIIADKAYDVAGFDANSNKFSNAVWDTNRKPDSDVDFLNFLKIPANSLVEAGRDFDSIYFSTSSYNRINSKIEPGNQKSIRILFNFIQNGQSNGGAFKGALRTATDFLLKFISSGGAIENITDPMNIKNETNGKFVQFTTGEVFEFLPNWGEKYFPDSGTNKISKYASTDVPYINRDDPYPGKIKLD